MDVLDEKTVMVESFRVFCACYRYDSLVTFIIHLGRGGAQDIVDAYLAFGAKLPDLYIALLDSFKYWYVLVVLLVAFNLSPFLLFKNRCLKVSLVFC